MSYGDTPTYEEENKELLRIQLDVDEELNKFEQEVLRGKVEVIDPKTGERKYELVAKDKKPPMNELGVREILSRMKGRVTKIAKLSYKTEPEIYKDMFYFDMSISELIAKRSDKWEMDMEITKSIKDAAVELVWDVLASSRDGFTAINLRSQYHKQDVSRTDSRPQGGTRNIFGIPIGRK
jgi:hypothetical protein